MDRRQIEDNTAKHSPLDPKYTHTLSNPHTASFRYICFFMETHTQKNHPTQWQILQ